MPAAQSRRPVLVFNRFRASCVQHWPAWTQAFRVAEPTLTMTALGKIVVAAKGVLKMPTIRKLTEQEVQTLENKGKGQRQLVEEQYDGFLADYGPGDYGEAELDEGENRLTVRNRFKAAAARRGLGLTFPRTTGNVIRFRVAPTVEAEVAPEPEPAAEPEPPPTSQAAPPRSRGGRKKAAAAPAR
jgi:hypothetical protein